MNVRNRRFGTAASETSQAALLPYMYYLHGDVVDNKFEAACFYEYATESPYLCEAARLWAENEYSSKKIIRGSVIWQCPSFPKKRWNQLSPRERANILSAFLPDQIEPLRVFEVLHLDEMGILDRLKTMAAESKKLHKGQRTVYPIIEGQTYDAKIHQRKLKIAWVHVLFTLDFGKTKTRLLQEFDQWLQLPENKARFDAHKQNPIGKTGAFKDRLKDFAAWRIYEGCGRDWEKANAFANDHRIKHRPFHDPREGQTKKTPLNEAPLYSGESGFLKAKKRALAYGMELIPWAFGKSAEDARRLQDPAPTDFPKTGSKDF